MAALWGQAEAITDRWKPAPSQQSGCCHPSVSVSSPVLSVPKAVGFSPKLPSELQQITPRLGAQAAEDGQEPRSWGEETWVVRVSPTPNPNCGYVAAGITNCTKSHKNST